YRIQVGQRVLEDHCNAAAIDLPARLGGQARQILPLEQDAARHDVARRAVHQAHHRAGADALAGTAFSKNNQRLSGTHMKRHIVHRAHRVVVGQEIHRQAVNAQDGMFALNVVHRLALFSFCSRQRCCGSAATRAQLDRMFSASVVSMMARPGQNAIHQAMPRYPRPLATIAPQVKSGGCMPRPRKLSADSARMTVAKSMADIVISVGTTSGAIWRSRMRAELAPIDRAALTNMRSRSSSTSARAVRKYTGMRVMASTITRCVTLGPSVYRTISASSSDGKLMMMSAPRWMTWLYQLSEYPATSPSRPPASIDIRTAAAAMASVLLAPTTSRASMGRPSVSAPSRYSHPASRSNGARLRWRSPSRVAASPTSQGPSTAAAASSTSNTAAASASLSRRR